MRSVTFAGICVVEALERLAFYAFLAFFTLYLTQSHGLSPAESTSLFGALMFGIYTLPLLSGWLIDRFVGTRRAVLAGSGLLTLGYLLLVDSHRLRLSLPLLLICLGSGLFRPSMLSLVASRSPRNGPRSESDFVWFVIALNLGAGISPLIAELTNAGYGISAVFLICSVSTALATLLTLAVIRSLGPAAAPSRGDSTDSQPINWRLLVPVFTSIALCELGLTQRGLLATLWGHGRVDHTFGGLISAQLGKLLLGPSSGSMYMLLLAPLVLTLLAILRRQGVVLTTPRKVIAAMALGLLACLTLVYVSATATDGAEVGFGWLLVGQLLAAVPGFLLYPWTLSLFARLIPVRRFATLLGLWITLKGLLNFLTGHSASLAMRLAPSAQFVIPTLLVLSGVCLWLVQLRKLERAVQ